MRVHPHTGRSPVYRHNGRGLAVDRPLPGRASKWLIRKSAGLDHLPHMQSPIPSHPAQRQLDALLKNASVAIFMMDEQYRCVYLNPAAEQLSGYSLAEM